jgi:hypothetical protein
MQFWNSEPLIMAQVVFFKISCIVKWTVGLKSMRILNFLAIHFHVSKNFPAKILIMNFLFDNTFTFTFTCFANKFQSRTFRCYKKLADWSGGQRHGSQRPTLIHDFHFFPPMSRVFFSPMACWRYGHRSRLGTSDSGSESRKNAHSQGSIKFITILDGPDVKNVHYFV